MVLPPLVSIESATGLPRASYHPTNIYPDSSAAVAAELTDVPISPV